jgi:hypothetical protein
MGSGCQVPFPGQLIAASVEASASGTLMNVATETTIGMSKMHAKANCARGRLRLHRELVARLTKSPLQVLMLNSISK